MQRPAWETYFLQIAHLVATRATCDRKHVGAVLVNERKRIVSTGYNGVPAGVPHCDEVGHTLAEIDGRDSCIATLHAESNALDDAGRMARGCTLYTTVIPCFECAKRIVNSGVVRVVYHEYYESRKTTEVEVYFDRVGIPLEQHSVETDL
jgi:dCMP deaminase